MAKTHTHTFPRQIFAIDLAGFIQLSDEDSYSGKDLLDAEDVGHPQAKAMGARIAKRYNMHEGLVTGLEKAKELIGEFRLKKVVPTQEVWEKIEALLTEAK